MAARRPGAARLSALFLSLLLSPACVLGADAAGSQAPEPAATELLPGVTALKPMIVLLGDSITEFGAFDGGWQLRMTGAYTRKADVINRGFSGYNSRWGTFLVDEILTALGGGARVKLCTVFFGANDAAGPDTSVGYLSVPVDEYASNIKAIVTRLQAANISAIVVTPPPVNDAGGRFGDGSRSNARARVYAEAAANIAKSMGVPHVDINALIQGGGADWRTALMHEDGLHMAPAGNALIFDAVMAAVREHFPHLAPAALPLHFPAFDRINVARPAETFGALYGRLQGAIGSAVAAAAAVGPAGGDSSSGSGGTGSTGDATSALAAALTSLGFAGGAAAGGGS